MSAQRMSRWLWTWWKNIRTSETMHLMSTTRNSERLRSAILDLDLMRDGSGEPVEEARAMGDGHDPGRLMRKRWTR